MKILRTKDDLKEAISKVRNLGFVPTMGSFHDGHISLIKKSQNNNKKTLVSIFVNPTQFNDNNDFKKYPRNLNLDIKILKKAAKKLVGTHNFNAFRASNCQSKSPVKTMKNIKIIKKNEKILFILCSQSFLKNQVRSIIGCLKYVGEKKWTIKDLEKVLKSKNRRFCAPPAPANGLYLSKVIY